MVAARIRIAWLALLVSVVGLICVPAGASAVTWPASTGLLVSEVMTGAASASDEFVEIYNASSSEVDLAGLELVYVTSSGATVTRKITWTAFAVGAHRHVLIANSAGVYAAGADGTYSGGLSATGGSLVLRTLGGTVIDSLSWGDAASTFVETHAGGAPPAGSSLERKPGAGSGNATDTNDNLADSFVNSAPVAQSLASAPVPVLAAPSASPSPTATPVCAWAPLPTVTAMPTVTAVPTATVPPTPTAVPTAAPTGSVVTLTGQLTTPTGLIDGGRTAYLDLGSGGIGLRLESADWPPMTAGTFVSATGVVGERNGETTLLLGSALDLVYLGDGLRPAPLWAATGLACEAFESRLIAVQGAVAGTTVDDGTGPLNFIVPSGVVIATDDLAPGNTVELVGVLSQVEQTLDGIGHYALIVTSAADVLVLGRPGTPTPSPTQTPAPTPTLSPSPPPSPRPIVDARLQPLGATVLIEGVVTAPAGRVLGDSVIAIQDASGGIYVRLQSGVAAPESGQRVEIDGVLAAPYGNLEIRPQPGGVVVTGSSPIPAPRPLAAADLGEATEGLLASLDVTVDSVEASSSGSVTLVVHDASGGTRVFFHAPLSATAGSFERGQRLAVVGLVGDRLGLYRLWPRDLADVTVVAEAPTPTTHPSATPRSTPRPSATPAPSASQPPSAISIADALRRQGATVSVSGTVTTRPGLLDADGRRVTIQDASGAILVRLPDDFDTQPGRRIRVTGAVGTYYGAPQLTAATAIDQGAAQPEAAPLHAAPIAPALEWRLVTVTGTVESVHRDGDAWRAELTVSGGSIAIAGLERSGITSTALVAGRRATITGIVKRAFPTASDQRLAIVPRSAADISLGAAQPTGHPSGSSPRPGTTPGATGHGTARPAGSPGPTAVLVGGSVKSVDGTLIVLSDAEGEVTIELVGDATPLAATLRPGDLVNATGEIGANGHLIVDDPAALVRVAALGGTSHPSTARPASFVAEGPDPMPTQPPQSAPIVAFGVLFGLAVALVVGAFAVRLYGPNRVRNWPKRLKSKNRHI